MPFVFWEEKRESPKHTHSSISSVSIAFCFRACWIVNSTLISSRELAVFASNSSSSSIWGRHVRVTGGDPDKRIIRSVICIDYGTFAWDEASSLSDRLFWISGEGFLIHFSGCWKEWKWSILIRRNEDRKRAGAGSTPYTLHTMLHNMLWSECNECLSEAGSGISWLLTHLQPTSFCPYVMSCIMFTGHLHRHSLWPNHFWLSLEDDYSWRPIQWSIVAASHREKDQRQSGVVGQ